MTQRRGWSAVVLAGGVGSRLAPLTTTKPKPLVPVGNRPMLDYNIQLLQNAGVSRIIVAVNYLGEQIREWLQNRYPALDIIVPDIKPLDTADAVRKCANFLDGPFLCTMADIITNISLSDLIQFHESRSAFTTVSLRHMDQPRQFGVIMLNSEQRILLFLEKPEPTDLYLTTLLFAQKETVHMHSNLVNTGMYAFEHEVIDLLENEIDLMDFGKHVFPFLARKKLKILGYVSNYYWMDCGRLDKYLWGNYDVARQWSWPYLPRGIQSNTGFWGNNIQWLGDAVLLGPVVVGHNVVIGHKAELLPLTTIGNNCMIGERTLLEGCVIWDNTRIGHDCVLRRCVVCDEAIIGDGAALEELAVVGKGAQVAPGARIRGGRIIQPGTNAG